MVIADSGYSGVPVKSDHQQKEIFTTQKENPPEAGLSKT